MNQFNYKGALFDNEASPEWIGAFQSWLLHYLSYDTNKYNQILNRPDIQLYYVVHWELDDTETVQLFAYLNNDISDLSQKIVWKMVAIAFRITQKRIQILDHDFHMEIRLNMFLAWVPNTVAQILRRVFLRK